MNKNQSHYLDSIRYRAAFANVVQPLLLPAGAFGDDDSRAMDCQIYGDDAIMSTPLKFAAALSRYVSLQAFPLTVAVFDATVADEYAKTVAAEHGSTDTVRSAKLFAIGARFALAIAHQERAECYEKSDLTAEAILDYTRLLLHSDGLDILRNSTPMHVRTALGGLACRWTGALYSHEDPETLSIVDGYHIGLSTGRYVLESQ